MRPLVVSEFVTLDGVMEAPGGEPSHPHTGWVMDYEDEVQVDDKCSAATSSRAWRR